MEKVKKQKTLGYVLGKIADWATYPILIIAFLSSFFMLVSKTKNVMPSFFGTYVVRILTGSMTNSGFKRGDTALIKQCDSNSYRVGDIIAFYQYEDKGDKNSAKISLYTTSGQGEVEGKLGNYPLYVCDENQVPIFNEELYVSTAKNPRQDRVSCDDIKDAGLKIVFHEIIDVRLETSTGTLFYQTKGSSNYSSDYILVREDYVVGKYQSMPFLSGVISFCSSMWGMLLLVVFPLSIIVLFELLSVLEQINYLMLEKKVLKRQIAFDRPECFKANIGIEMREFDKAYYYDVMPNEFKAQVFDYLWSWNQTKGDKKNSIIFNTATSAAGKYDVNNVGEYYNEFINNAKRKRTKRKFQKAMLNAISDRYKEVEVKEYQNQPINNIDESNKVN